MEQSVVVNATDVLQDLVGPNDRNIKLIEKMTGAIIHPKGNQLSVESDDPVVCDRVEAIFQEMQRVYFQGRGLDEQLVLAIISQFVPDITSEVCGKAKTAFQREAIVIPGGLQPIFPRTLTQAVYMSTLAVHDIAMAIGPAGTGKTYLSIAFALQEVLQKKYRKLILSRPVVEAGESLGFLPGDLAQKLHPYLRPLYDAMSSLISSETLQRMHDQDLIEIAPLAYMRGRSLSGCCIILDEAQNTTVEQMKMFLTRLGNGSKMIITGDITQIDLPRRQKSGLFNAVEALNNVEEIGMHFFSQKDVVRHPLVQKILSAYSVHEDEQVASGGSN